MKKVSLLLGMMMMVSSVLFAQDRGAADERAMEIVQELTSQHEINEDQYEQVLNTTSSILQRVEHINNTKEDMNEDMRTETMKELHANVQRRSEIIFEENPEVQEAYMEMISEYIR